MIFKFIKFSKSLDDSRQQIELKLFVIVSMLPSATGEHLNSLERHLISRGGRG